MIVDDEPEIREITKAFLEDNEYNVIVVPTNREAINLLEDAKEENVDLILVKTVIPGSTDNGFFSMRPTSTMQTADTDTFLQRPFTRDQLREFVKNRFQ
jgi:CheY-like chemotaxis protein